MSNKAMEAVVAAVEKINDHHNDCNINLTARPYLTTRVEIVNEDNDGHMKIMFSGDLESGFWWAKGFFDALGLTDQLVYDE
jgi:hypothetical protein